MDEDKQNHVRRTLRAGSSGHLLLPLSVWQHSGSFRSLLFVLSPFCIIGGFSADRSSVRFLRSLHASCVAEALRGPHTRPWRRGKWIKEEALATNSTC